MLQTVPKNISLKMIIKIMITQPLFSFSFPLWTNWRCQSIQSEWFMGFFFSIHFSWSLESEYTLAPGPWPLLSCWELHTVQLFSGVAISLAWRLPPEGCEEQLATQHSLWQEQNDFSSLHVSIRSVSEVYSRKEKHQNWLTPSNVC